MTREDIIDELNNRGYAAKPLQHTQTGADCIGVQLGDTEVNALVCMDKIEEIVKKTGKTMDDRDTVMNVTITYINMATAYKKQWNLREILSTDYIIGNIYIGLAREDSPRLKGHIQRKSWMEGISEYLYILIGNDYDDTKMVRLTKQILDYSKINETAAWELARTNTCAATIVDTIEEQVLKSLKKGGLEETDAEYILTKQFMDSTMSDDRMEYVVRFKDRISGGAAGIIDREKIKALARKIGVDKFYVLPSSTNEMLLVPYSDERDVDDLRAILKNINGDPMAVPPEEVLSDEVFIMEIERQ
jgi:hypothetical protein